MTDSMPVLLPFLPVARDAVVRLREILEVAEPGRYPRWFAESFDDPCRVWIMESLAGIWVGQDNTWGLDLWEYNRSANQVSNVRLVEPQEEGEWPALQFDVRSIPFGGQESLDWMIIAAGGLPFDDVPTRSLSWYRPWNDRGAPGTLMAVLWHYLGRGDLVDLLEEFPSVRDAVSVLHDEVGRRLHPERWTRQRSPLFIRKGTVVDDVPTRQIRAVYDAESIVVYQAYRAAIADAALSAGRFVPPFSMDRMTWIKPSFLWMMYRSGWAQKPGQERVLAIRIRREGFEWAIRHAQLTHFDPDVHASVEAYKELPKPPVRIQWDPERDLRLDRLPYRSIQIGLRGEASHRYVNEWALEIEEVSERVGEIRELVEAGDLVAAHALLPDEDVYPLPDGIGGNVGLV